MHNVFLMNIIHKKFTPRPRYVVLLNIQHAFTQFCFLSDALPQICSINLHPFHVSFPCDSLMLPLSFIRFAIIASVGDQYLQVPVRIVSWFRIYIHDGIL